MRRPRTARNLHLVLLLASLAPAADADTFVVSNTSPSGPGSLADAVGLANGNAGADRIEFAIPGAGPHVIRPNPGLPNVTDPLVIDGRTQPGYAGTPLVVVDNQDADGGVSVALFLMSDQSQVIGLGFVNAIYGLVVWYATGVDVRECHFGCDASGTAAVPNVNGIEVEGSSLVTIEDNLISGNTSIGLNVDIGCVDVAVLNNRIGTDVTGTGALPNHLYGVQVRESSFVYIYGNTIAYNTLRGIYVLSSGNPTPVILQGTTLRCNGGPGLELGPGDPPPNDPLDADVGPNGLQNYPVLASATDYGGTTRVVGSLHSTPGTQFGLEVFRNAECLGAGAEAEELVSTGTFITTDAGGDAAFELWLAAPIAPGEELTAMVTSVATFDTSWISPPVAVVDGSQAVHVDSDAPPGGDGTGWATAFSGLQDALDVVEQSAGGVGVVRLGGGLYLPSRERTPGDPRSRTFAVPAGAGAQLVLLGGFAGHGAADPDARDFAQWPSVLSGDLAGDDWSSCCPVHFSESSTDDNAYHVVLLDGSGLALTLSGLVVRGGHATGSGVDALGGGVLALAGILHVEDCELRHCSADDGGGVYVGSGVDEASLARSLFYQNRAESRGGGLYLAASYAPTDFDAVQFLQNHGVGEGGGAYSVTYHTSFVDTLFALNTSPSGAGLRNVSPESSDLRHCTVAYNSGLGLSCEGPTTVRNSILWSNAAPFGGAGTFDVEHSVVQGGHPGAGNLSGNPRLLFDPQVLGQTASAGLFAIRADSPCIDAADSAWTDPGTDLLGNPRPVDHVYTPDTGPGPAPLGDVGAVEHVQVEPGVPFCFGDGSVIGCPCGNNTSAYNAGCRHSSGYGMSIRGEGSRSISADDLTVVVGAVPPGNSGLIYCGTDPLAVPNLIWDGLQCVLGQTRRFAPQFQSSGVFTDTGFVAQDPTGDYFVPGVQVHFQLWTRDAAAASPCGTGANYSPAYSVLMEP